MLKDNSGGVQSKYGKLYFNNRKRKFSVKIK